MKRHSANDMCERNDFRSLFASPASQLHRLCYTLTGDEELTARVLDAALEQSLKGAEGVFREWMLSWARRLTIKVCIELVRPAISNIVPRPYFAHLMAPDLVNPMDLERVLSQPSEVLQKSLLRLDTLSRFVFVLRALEGYSRRDTGLLLNLDDRNCEWVYYQAAFGLQAAVGKSIHVQLDLEVTSLRQAWLRNVAHTEEQNRTVAA